MYQKSSKNKAPDPKNKILDLKKPIGGRKNFRAPEFAAVQLLIAIVIETRDRY